MTLYEYQHQTQYKICKPDTHVHGVRKEKSSGIICALKKLLMLIFTFVRCVYILSEGKKGQEFFVLNFEDGYVILWLKDVETC